MHKLLLLLILNLLAFYSFSQGEEFSIHYLNNPFLYNPALTSTEDYGEASLGSSFNDDGIQSLYAGFRSTLSKTNGRYYHHKSEHISWHGWGASIFASETNRIKSKGIVANYSYNVSISDKTRLSLGVKAGVDHLEHQEVNTNDWSTNFGGGFHFYSNNYSVSFSTNGSKEFVSHNEKAFISGSYPLFLSGQYKIQLSQHFSFIPQWVSLINVDNPNHLAVLKFDYRNNISLSALLGTDDAFYWGVNAGYVLNQLFELNYQLRKKGNYFLNEVVLKYRIRRIICRGGCSPSNFW